MALVPGEWSPKDPEVHAKLVSNLIKRTKEFTPGTITGGAKWYGNAQKDAIHFGEATKTDVMTGGAAMGRLSGGTEFNMNRLQAIQIPRLSEKQQKGLENVARIQEEGASKDVTKPMKLKLNLEGTPLWHQTTKMAVDAIKLARGEHKNPMDVFGKPSNASNKTADFGMGIATGGSHPFPTIDTHAYDAAHDSYNIKYGTANEHLTKVGVYQALQSAYADAHAHAIHSGMVPSHTTLADFQAMHWVHHIANKRVENPKSVSAAKASETKVTNILKRNPELDPVKSGLPPLSTSRDLAPSVMQRTSHFLSGTSEGR